MAEADMSYDGGFKFLAIKNWERYQVRDRKHRDIKAYVKDYCGKDIDDPEYNGLTMAQRYLCDACCRIRGRSGRNLRNDPVWVARALGVIPKERTCLPHNLQVLIECGFLIPTNQEVGSSDPDPEPETEPKTETETERSAPRSGAGSPLPSGEKTNPVGPSVFDQKQNQKQPQHRKPCGCGDGLCDWSESVPGCSLTAAHIGDCVYYQRHVKNNDYFIKRLSRGYLLQEWKRIVADTPEEYSYDPDPLFGERTSAGVGDEPDTKIKFVRRRPKNEAERRLLQKDDRAIAHNAQWLYKDPCPYGCKQGYITIYPFPDNPKLTASEYCRCLGE